MANGLKRSGHTVSIAVACEVDHRGRHADPLGVPTVSLPPGRWPRGLRTMGEIHRGRRLARAARVFGRPDRIWERYSLLCDGGVRLARALQVPHLLEVNAPLSRERRPHRLEAQLLRRTDRVVAVSPWLAKWARVQGARRVRWVPNGSDLQPGDREKTRAALGLKGLVLVHHGSMRSWHGLASLPQLLDRVDATLLLVGHGPRPTHPRILSLPPCGPKRLADLLAAADVAVAPYPRDAPPWFDPLKIHDARAVGLPVVGSQHPACRLADHTADSWTSEDWAATILEAAEDEVTPRSRPWEQVVVEGLEPWTQRVPTPSSASSSLTASVFQSRAPPKR